MKTGNLTREELMCRLNKAEKCIKELEGEVCRYREKELQNNKKISWQMNRINMLEEILHTIPAGIMIVDEDRKITEMNKALIDSALKEPEEILGQKGGVALRCSESGNGCGDGPICVDCPLKNSVENVLDTGEPIFGLETKANVLMDGEVSEAWLRVNMIRIIIEERKHVVIIIEDISLKKDMEKLEKNFKQSEQKLVELKEYDKLKTQFFSTVSHEFRTPLNIILAIVQLFEERNEMATEESCKILKKHVKMMKQNCYRLLRLINNLIDITKLDSGFMNMNLKNYNIVEVVENVTLSVAEYLKSHKINLIFDTEIEEKIMACDVDGLERVILNLLSNATKFARSGGSISVNIYDKSDRISIKVKDTGIGIPKSKIDKIFDRFEQVDSSLRRRKEGSGIGLSLVKAIVEAHGGTITAESEYGLGSEFTIELPVFQVGQNTGTEDEVATTVETKVERIHIEFSDIYS
ncbi:ATP-binding protein [Wukongibacter baidiensis]|uniref:sensor histidine kinase n=1 Tax=Wukongibacter baidiensis TaxID=1723361 RepID=UPI003D7F82A9